MSRQILSFFGGIVPENQYQQKLIKKIKVLFPGCYVLKNDPSYNQGIPDLIVLFKDKWGMLEVKIKANATEQPNQRYYVEQLSDMSFAAFISPDNEEEVLYELQRAFGVI